MVVIQVTLERRQNMCECEHGPRITENVYQTYSGAIISVHKDIVLPDSNHMLVAV